MKAKRKDLLQRLLCIEPGISHSGKHPEQTWCVVFRKGRIYSQCVEIACSIPSKLPLEFDFAMRAEKLTSLLKHLPEDEVEVNFSQGELTISGKDKRRRAKLKSEPQVLLPINSVELPSKEAWQSLHPNFVEAVELVVPCTKRKGEFMQETVHIHPQWLEASDSTQIARYEIPTPVKESVLTYGRSLTHITQLGFTETSETNEWLHFRNPMPLGLRLSIRKYGTKVYPDMSKILSQRGQRMEFPKGMKEASALAGIFTDDGPCVKVTASNNLLTITGVDNEGEYIEEKKYSYSGPDFAFKIPEKLLTALLRKYTVCELTPQTLRVSSEKYTYVSALELGA